MTWTDCQRLEQQNVCKGVTLVYRRLLLLLRRLLRLGLCSQVRWCSRRLRKRWPHHWHRSLPTLRVCLRGQVLTWWPPRSVVLTPQSGQVSMDLLSVHPMVCVICDSWCLLCACALSDL